MSDKKQDILKPIPDEWQRPKEEGNCTECDWYGKLKDCPTETEGDWEYGYWECPYCPKCGGIIE